MSVISGLGASLSGEDEMGLRQAEVTAYTAGNATTPPTVTCLTCDGSLEGVTIASGSTPVVGDIVWVSEQTGRYVVMGVQQNSAPTPSTDDTVYQPIVSGGTQQATIIQDADIRGGEIKFSTLTGPSIDGAISSGGVFTNPIIIDPVIQGLDISNLPGLTFNSPVLQGPDIRVATITSPQLDGGTEVVGSGSIKSANYVAGSAGWAIDGQGVAEFNDIIVRNSGMIGGVALGLTDMDGIVDGGSIASENYSAGSAGWAINGAGDAEFNNVTVRGTLSAGTFTGTNTVTTGTSNLLKSQNYSAGSTGWEIDGSGNAEFNNITARGTIETAGSGTRITFGSLGNDEISFYSSTETYPGAIEVGASKVTLYVPSDTNNSGHGPEVAVFGEAGSDVYMDTGVFTVNNQTTSFSGSLVGFANISDDATETYSYYGSTWAGRLRVGRGSGGTWGTLVSHTANLHTTYLGLFHSDLSDAVMIMSNGTDTYVGSDDDIWFRNGSTNVAHFNASGDLFVRGQELYIGKWPSGLYEGVMHTDLASDYMIMSDGTSTFVGGDSQVTIRPNGNGGGEIKFEIGATGNGAIVGANGTTGRPTYSFANDTDCGMWYTTNLLNFSVSGSNKFFIGATSLGLGSAVAGITYGGTTGTGAANKMGFKWSSPNMYCRVDNSVEAIIGVVSDRRLKENILPMPPDEGLRRINALNPVNFQALPLHPEDGEVARPVRRPGLIADEVEVEEPWAVPETEGTDYQTVDYIGLVGLLVAAVQDLSRQLTPGPP